MSPFGGWGACATQEHFENVYCEIVKCVVSWSMIHHGTSLERGGGGLKSQTMKLIWNFFWGGGGKVVWIFTDRNYTVRRS